MLTWGIFNILNFCCCLNTCFSRMEHLNGTGTNYKRLLCYTLIFWNYTETINVAIKLSTNIKVTINKPVCVCVWSWRRKAEGTSCIPHVCSVSLSPSGADVVFVVKSRTRSLISHLTACPKQMGDSGNWHQRPRLAVAALSLSRDATPLPILSFRLSRAWRCQIHKRGLLHEHIQLRSVQASEM